MLSVQNYTVHLTLFGSFRHCVACHSQSSGLALSTLFPQTAIRAGERESRVRQGRGNSRVRGNPSQSALHFSSWAPTCSLSSVCRIVPGLVHLVWCHLQICCTARLAKLAAQGEIVFLHDVNAFGADPSHFVCLQSPLSHRRCSASVCHALVPLLIPTRKWIFICNSCMCMQFVCTLAMQGVCGQIAAAAF